MKNPQRTVCRSIPIVALMITVLCGFSNIAEAKKKKDSEPTYAELQKERALSNKKDQQFTDNIIKEAQLESDVKQTKLRIALMEAERKERDLKALMDSDEKNTTTKKLLISPNPAKSDNAQLPQKKAQIENNLMDSQYEMVNKYLANMKGQVFLVGLYTVAGRIEGDFLIDGGTDYGSIGDPIGEDWVITELTLRHAIIEKTEQGKIIKKRLSLKGYSNAIHQFKESNDIEKKLIESHINNATSMSLMNTTAPQQLYNDSPAPGQLYK